MAEKGGQNRDHLLALALARGESVTTAAKQAGCSERTAHRRLECEAFRRLVSKLRGQIVEQSVGVLSSANVNAAQTLTKLLDEDSPQIRLSASKAILELSAKMRETLELEERIRLLEDQQAGCHDGPAAVK